jgi:hypothetical protein
MYLLVVVALVSAFWLLFDPAGLMATDEGQAICEEVYGQDMVVNADYIGCLLDASQQRALMEEKQRQEAQVEDAKGPNQAR